MTEFWYVFGYFVIASLVFGVSFQHLDNDAYAGVFKKAIMGYLYIFAVIWPLSIPATLAFHFTRWLRNPMP